MKVNRQPHCRFGDNPARPAALLATVALCLAAAPAVQAQTAQFSAAFTDGSGGRIVTERLESDSFGIRVRITNGVTFAEEKTITVWFFAGAGTAVYGSDYSWRTLTATLPAGASTARITGLALVNDGNVELREHVEIAVGLDLDEDAVLDPTDIVSERAVLWIEDDDRQELIFREAHADELFAEDSSRWADIEFGPRSGDSCAVGFVFTVYVSYAFTDEPYMTLPSENPFPIVFEACQRARAFRIPLQDVSVWRDRDVVFTLERTEVFGEPFPRLVPGASAKLIVRDENNPPVVRFEGNTLAATEGSGELPFWAEVTPQSVEEIRFRARTSDAYQSKAGKDYEPLDTIVTVPPGQRWVTIPVRLIDDSIAEDHEEVLLTVSEVTGAWLEGHFINPVESAAALGEIRDDDGGGQTVVTVATLHRPREAPQRVEGETVVILVNALDGPSAATEGDGHRRRVRRRPGGVRGGGAADGDVAARKAGLDVLPAHSHPGRGGRAGQ